MLAFDQVTLIDVAVLAIYLAILVIACVLDFRRAKRVRDLFLAGNSATWPRIGFSLFASTISITSLVGLSGTAYRHGISVFNYEWMAAIVLTVFCAVVLPVYLKSKVFTVPEFLEMRFGRFARTYLAILTVFMSIFLDASCGLVAGASVFAPLFQGWAFGQVCGLLAGLAVIFFVVDGFRGVMLIDAIQGAVLTAACAITAFVTFHAAGWHAAFAVIPQENLHLFMSASDATMPWTGLVSGVPLIGFYFWCTNQGIVQRVLAAKTLDHGRWGSLLAGAFKLLPLFLVILPGAAAIALFPNLSQPDQVFSGLLFALVPHGLIGLILGACLVSVVSGLAGTYNASSTVVTMDFIRRFRPTLTDRHLILIGRGVAVAIMVLSLCWAPQILRFKDTLWQYLQIILSYFVTPTAAVFLCGLFLRRVNGQGAALALTLGTLFAGGLFWTVEVLQVFSLQFLLSAAAIFGVTAAIAVATSLAFPPPRAEQTDEITFSWSVWREETEQLRSRRWYQNYRYLSLVLIALTLAIVFAYR